MASFCFKLPRKKHSAAENEMVGGSTKKNTMSMQENHSFSEQKKLRIPILNNPLTLLKGRGVPHPTFIVGFFRNVELNVHVLWLKNLTTFTSTTTFPGETLPKKHPLNRGVAVNSA